MTTGDRAAGPEDRIGIRSDLAVAEVDEAVGHFDLCGKDANHLCIVDRLGEIHQAAAFRVELSAGFDEAADGCAHGEVSLELPAIELGVATANVQKVGLG